MIMLDNFAAMMDDEENGSNDRGEKDDKLGGKSDYEAAIGEIAAGPPPIPSIYDPISIDEPNKNEKDNRSTIEVKDVDDNDNMSTGMPHLTRLNDPNDIDGDDDSKNDSMKKPLP